MSQAPPTPPPLSAIELRDEARDSAASSHATSTSDDPGNLSVPLQPTQDNIYQHIFPQLSDLAQERNFVGIINIAELHDLNVSTSLYRSFTCRHRESCIVTGFTWQKPHQIAFDRPLSPGVFGDRWLVRKIVHLIVHPYNTRLRTPAHHALARLPEHLCTHPLSHALAALLASASERQYENTYARAQALFQMSQQSDFPDPRLGKVVALMVNDFVGTCSESYSVCCPIESVVRWIP